MRIPVAALLLVVGMALLPVSGTSAAAATPTPQTGRVAAPQVDPAEGAVVGVAKPVIVRFSAPVTDRAAAQDSVTITASNPVTGNFTWLAADTLQWAPAGFWPAYTSVTVTAAGFKTNFEVGRSLVAVADVANHWFTVSVDGVVVQEMPASMGKPGFETPYGTFPVLEKFRTLVMDSSTIGIPVNSPEGYKITADYAVRITWGGVFVHAAPWSVDSQGYANVSHGCINLSTGNAGWFYNNAYVGDPVIVT